MLSLSDAVDADNFGGTFHLSRMDRKTLPVDQESAQFVTRRRFSLSIRPRVAEALLLLLTVTLLLSIIRAIDSVRSKLLYDRFNGVGKLKK